MEDNRYEVWTMEVDEENCIIPFTDKWHASFVDLVDALNYYSNMVKSVRLSNKNKKGVRTRVALENIVNGVVDVSDEIVDGEVIE